MKIKPLYGIAPALLLAACWQPDPLTYECLTQVNSYYSSHPLASRSGWLFRGAKDHGGEVRVGFLVPKSLSVDPNRGRAILDRICPGKFEELWQSLPSGTRLVIDVWTKDSNFSDSIEC